MSRIGKLPIKLDDKVKATVAGHRSTSRAPRASCRVKLPGEIKVEVKDGDVAWSRAGRLAPGARLHGLARTILANAAKGVATGFERSWTSAASASAPR